MKNVCVQGRNYYLSVSELQLCIMGLDQESALLCFEETEIATAC